MRRCLVKVAGVLMGRRFVSGRASVCVCVGVGVDVDVDMGGCTVVALGAGGGGEGLASGLDVAALIARIGRHETTERSACLLSCLARLLACSCG